MSFTIGAKRIRTLIILLLGISFGKQSFGQTPGANYTRTRIPEIPMTDTSKLDTIPAQRQAVSILYSDPLGRISQSIQIQGSPNKKDIITPYSYNNMGRPINTFMSYADQNTTISNTGQFRDTAVNSMLNFYSPTNSGAPKIPTDIAPYAQTVYEISPLGRIMEQGGIGIVFQPGTNHTVRVNYNLNSSTDNINHYLITNGVPVVVSPFSPGVLTKTIVADGNGNRAAVWKDLQGKTVTRTALDAPSLYYSTDYVYNDLNQLINIVTPIGKKQLANASVSLSNLISQESYGFHYDSIGRVVEKRVPGKGWEYTIYNHRDEPVLLQDSNMRSKGQWIFIKYDAEGRMVQTGIYINTIVTGRKTLQYLCDNSFQNLWEAWQPGIGYTNNAFPQQNANPGASALLIYTTFYYDDYSFAEAAAKPFQTNIYGSISTYRTMGLLTGVSTNILGTNKYLTTVNYYDNQNELIQEISDNHLGLIDVENYRFSFMGQLIGDQRITTPIEGNTITIQDRYVYDHLNRLLDTYESLNGSPEIDISHNVYNEISQKVSEGLHSTNNGVSFAQTQEFRYSIRGELTNINNGTLTNDGVTQSDPNALFGESITYSEPSSLGTGVIPQYNGNISSITWRNKIEQIGMSGVTTGGQGYSFKYDLLSRLMQSSYFTQSGTSGFTQSPTGAFAENVRGYDEMGNIDTLQRTDKNGNILNNLTYNYSSNGIQLQSINDAGSLNISGSFTYDENGNMISDSRKGIVITYNYLNLPDTIKQSGNKLVFTYDATGKKLYKQLIEGDAVVSQRHYIEDVELTASSSIAYDGKVESIAMDEGRIVNAGAGNYQYEYYLQDHLYTNRVAFRPNNDGSLSITSIQNYYPFGGDMGDATINYSASPQNLYKYNGKEFQPELNLNTYDFGARHYDPTIGRWTTIDPMAGESEELSPYNYVADNPMNLIDQDGMQPNPDAIAPGKLPVITVTGGQSGSAIGAFNYGGALFEGVLGFKQASGVFNIQNAKVISQNWGGLGKVQRNVLSPQATLTTWQPNGFDKWKSGGFLGKFTYDIVDQAYVSVTSIFWPFGDVTHLNGEYASAKDKQSAFAYTVASFIPVSKGTVVTKVALEEFAERGTADVVEQVVEKNGSTVANRLGQAMHKAYHAADVLENVRIKEYTLPSGRRIDFIDLQKKIIYELKPNNPRALRLGKKQLAEYLKEVEAIWGPGFKTVLDKY